MRDVDAGAGHEMVFGDRYHDELRLAGGSACTAAQAIHELLPKADTGKLMRWVRRSAQFAVLCLVLVSNAFSPGGPVHYKAERCVYCPISSR